VEWLASFFSFIGDKCLYALGQPLRQGLNLVLGDSLTMIAKTIVCIVSILLGIYGAWWASSLAHAIYIEKVSSFDDLSTIMLMWFLITAAILCPILCWGALRVLMRMNRKYNV
jgi:uncharacterized membrane protein YeaQ/YmgE (transglycosylase-associated protein family)